MARNEAEDLNPEENRDSGSEGDDGNESEDEGSEWTKDEDGISDRRWETMRDWSCDISPEEDDEHRHLFEEHCIESRAALIRRAELIAENEMLKRVSQAQDECLARIHERTENLKRRNAERTLELAALREARAKRMRENGPAPG